MGQYLTGIEKDEFEIIPAHVVIPNESQESRDVQHPRHYKKTTIKGYALKFYNKSIVLENPVFSYLFFDQVGPLLCQTKVLADPVIALYIKSRGQA